MENTQPTIEKKISDVFTLARMQVVASNPMDKDGLKSLLIFEEELINALKEKK